MLPDGNKDVKRRKLNETKYLHDLVSTFSKEPTNNGKKRKKVS